MTSSINVSKVVQLVHEQLQYYNIGNVEGLCACYADDVVIKDGDGKVILSGIEAFRRKYNRVFESHTNIHADILDEIHCGQHVVAHESWRRTNAKTGEVFKGEMLVRFSERGGKITILQFI